MSVLLHFKFGKKCDSASVCLAQDTGKKAAGLILELEVSPVELVRKAGPPGTHARQKAGIP